MAISNKNIVITGGSRGIGAQAVRMFSARGSNVAFLYKQSFDAALSLAKETGALSVQCDVSKPDEVEKAMGTISNYFGREIDVLICNAGISDFNLITDIGVDRWREMIETNLSSSYYCIKEVLPGMISSQKGSIIIVSSMWGQVGASCEVAYSAAKAGLIGLTKALAKEVGPSNIRVNCIAPGLIDTDMNDEIDEASLDEIVESTPMGRMGRSEDVVNTMAFLASDASDFVTGQVIGISGGLVV